MQAEGAERESAQEVQAETDVEAAAASSPRFRLPKRTLFLALFGLLVLVAIAAGSWIYVANSHQQEAAQRAKAEARADAEAEALKAAVVQSSENQTQLEAARKAHAEIMASDTAVAAGGAGLSRPAVVPVAPAVGSAAVSATAARPLPSEKSPPAPATPASVQLTPNGCMVQGSSAKDAANALGRCLEEFNRLEQQQGSENTPPATKPPPARGGAKSAESAAASAPAALTPNGCTVTGAGPQDYGAALGRCLEEYNRMEQQMREAEAPPRRLRPAR